MKLVIYPTMDTPRLAQIQAVADSLQIVNAATEQEALAEMAAADAFFGKITPSLLKPATNLKWVQSPTASLEHYLFPELAAHQCILTNMRGLYYDVIADHVFGYILMFARRLHLYLRQQIENRWQPIGGEEERSSFSLGPSHVSGMDRAHLHMADCTLGIIGLGSIGAEIARRGASFSMTVRAVDPSVTSCPEGVQHLGSMDDLEGLLQTSDFVVIAAPHTPETEGMFAEREFQLMKAGAYLINIGRGAIVRLDDLVRALEQQQLAGAALDVFETEPLPPEHPLWQMPNVLITPHVAACSPHIAIRHLETLCHNIKQFAAGLPLINVTNKQKWY
ncbi:MAG: D-2-hydroxyacid dehydrogenase [Pirellulaceae bacterium]